MSRFGKSVLGATLGLAAGACAADRSPVMMAATFTPADGMKWTYAPKRGEAAPSPCRIGVTEVRDTRIDPTVMGNLGARIVKIEDTAAWVRSGLQALTADSRLLVVEPDAGAHVQIKVELTKAYIQSLQTINTANIVVRVVYRQAGIDAGEKSFRGEQQGVNFASGDDEARYVLNQALAQVVHQIDQDMVARCEFTSGKPGIALMPPMSAPAPAAPPAPAS